jgi:hypothetical protein
MKAKPAAVNSSAGDDQFKVVLKSLGTAKLWDGQDRGADRKRGRGSFQRRSDFLVVQADPAVRTG